MRPGVPKALVRVFFLEGLVCKGFLCGSAPPSASTGAGTWVPPYKTAAPGRETRRTRHPPDFTLVYGECIC
jgi:hypothetical protein